MKNYRFHMILFITLLLMLALVEIYKPVKHNWTPSLINNDKDPYGAFILYHELGSLFPGKKIIESRVPVDELDLKRSSGNNYIIILPEFPGDSLDAEKIREFAEKGNSVLIASERFPAHFLNKFGLGFSSEPNPLTAIDSTLYFCNPAINFRQFSVPAVGNPSLFPSDSGLEIKAMIRNKKGDNKMISLKCGEGEVFLCTLPLLFSNYSILESEGKAAAIALSCLPADGSIIWDEYYKQGRDEIQSPIRYILKNRSTYWAYILTLAGLLLFLVFQLKRPGAMVPVVEPYKNTSLEFLKAVALLHYEQRDYSDISRKKAAYFLELLRTKLHISTTTLNEDFANLLSARTTFETGETKQLIHLINQVIERGADRETFIDLNKKIENFLQKTGIKI